MPVSRVCHGIGLSGPPSMVMRSTGTPVTISQSTAASPSTTISIASPRMPMPDQVSITATARNPPKMV